MARDSLSGVRWVALGSAGPPHDDSHYQRGILLSPGSPTRLLAPVRYLANSSQVSNRGGATTEADIR